MPVTIMTGIVRSRFSSRSFFSVSYPSICGISTSSRMRCTGGSALSGSLRICSCRICRHLTPLEAVTTWYPRSLTKPSATIRSISLSSTTMISVRPRLSSAPEPPPAAEAFGRSEAFAAAAAEDATAAACARAARIGQRARGRWGGEGALRRLTRPSSAAELRRGNSPSASAPARGGMPRSTPELERR